MQQPPLFNFIVQQNHTGVANDIFLTALAKQYPYFTPAQFYLLQQLPQNDAEYQLQAAKTAILFNNPHWLHFKLQQQHTATTTTEPLPVQNIANTTAQEKVKEILSPEQIMLSQSPIDDDDILMEEEISPIKITIPAPISTAPIDNNTLAFEPMHLVDYFASQGIKLTDEVQTTDKLGQQLKSFTQWLKTMKKIHVPDTEANAGISDMAIQTLAAKSNKEGEIVTESMAEVLIQQGKTGKAIEVYKKLSLLNPSKSAFFAAKIEQLKG